MLANQQAAQDDTETRRYHGLRADPRARLLAVRFPSYATAFIARNPEIRPLPPLLAAELAKEEEKQLDSNLTAFHADLTQTRVTWIE